MLYSVLFLYNSFMGILKKNENNNIGSSDAFSDDSEIKVIKEKYSKKSLNPFTNHKNKKLEKEEIDALLKKREEEKKKEEKRLKKEKRDAHFKKYKFVYIGALVILVAISLVKNAIDKKKTTVAGINFVNVSETYYVGDKVELPFEVIPNTAIYSPDEITVSLSDPSMVNDNILTKEGKLKVSILYNGIECDSVEFDVKPVLVSKIILNETEVGIGNEIELKPIIEPNNATNKEYTISVEDENIASITGNTIKGLALGSTKINIKSADGSFKGTFDINVIEIEPESISIKNSRIYYTVGDKDIITVVYQPENTTSRKVMYSSSNKNVVSIDQDGNIEALDAGDATITVKYNDEIYCEHDVHVDYPPAQSISLSANYTTLYVGNSTKLICSFTPTKNSDKEKVKYSTSDSSTVSVDENGTVTAISIGSAVITATIRSDCKDSITINVVERPAEPAPVAPSSSSSSGSTHIEGDGTVVYITPHGKKYHKDPSCPASDSVYSTSLDKLPSRITGPCEKCWR